MSDAPRDLLRQFNGRAVDLTESLDRSVGGPSFGTRPGPRSLYVASTGGHLAQLVRFAPRLDPLGEPLWVTFDSPQSRSLLRGEDVVFVPVVAPRDLRGVVRNVPVARRIFDEHDVAEVISTGSAIALSFVPIARRRSIPVHYIESAARTTSPSITGRLVARIPGANLYSQYGQWPSARWRPVGSVFEGFEPGPDRGGDRSEIVIAISLGTLPYRFDALVDAIERIREPHWRLVWQVGPSPYANLTGDVHELLRAAEFAELCASADVVISHAGVGSALTALEVGRHPILVPRSASRGEHVDDHQGFVARELDRRGIASCCEPTALTPRLIEWAARQSVVDRDTAPKVGLRRTADSAARRT